MSRTDSSLQGRRWNRARNKDRNEARYIIRQRISLACSDAGGKGQSTMIPDPPHRRENLACDTKCIKELEEIQGYFNSVSKGSASAFSLKVISAGYNLLSSPHDSAFMSNYKISTLCTSRFGKDVADAVLLYREKIPYCSLIEYASLIGEYGVVSALLAGGINPSCFVREEDGINNMRKNEVSKLAMQKLVADLIPSSLAVYIIKSLFEMKMWSVVRFNEGHTISREECPLCYTTTSEPLLTFAASCNHKCCELCTWENILQNINHWTKGNVVRCPTCEGCLDDCALSDGKIEDSGINLTPIQRREKSLCLFHSLPKDVEALKKLSKKAKSKNITHSTWYSALVPSIGSSQDVRRDKFVRYVNCGAIHHCRACLQAGIDVNLTNEYNQTPLYIACWRNHVSLVRLLLEWGADPNIQANGNVAALNVATEHVLTEIAQLVSKYTNQVNSTTLQSRITSIGSIHKENKFTKTAVARLTTLIPKDIDHAGAGSCFIENSVPESVLEFLDGLWSTLPLASATDLKKKKSGTGAPCSDRYFFCDAEGYFSTMLANHIESTLNRNDDSMINVMVFPHMRFLNYREPGSVLAPHVDLFKKDANTGKRSTHTFILYLKDCDEGGETALLKELSSGGPLAEHEVIAKVSPKRGRLLLFPHAAPHEGREVISTPKLLLRGEIWVQ